MLLVAEWMVLLVLHLLMILMIVIVFSDIGCIHIAIHVVVIHLLLSRSKHILLHFLSLGHLTCFHVVFRDLLTLIVFTRLFFLHSLQAHPVLVAVSFTLIDHLFLKFLASFHFTMMGDFLGLIDLLLH